MAAPSRSWKPLKPVYHLLPPFTTFYHFLPLFLENLPLSQNAIILLFSDSDVDTMPDSGIEIKLLIFKFFISDPPILIFDLPYFTIPISPGEFPREVPCQTAPRPVTLGGWVPTGCQPIPW